MANITLAIPDDLHKKMKEHSEIRWSEVVRKVIHEKIEELEIMDQIMYKSKMDKKSVDMLADKFDSATAKKLGLK